jgi:hypothetical protein
VRTVLLAVAVTVGCQRSAPPAPEVLPVTTDSEHTWAYFFRADDAPAALARLGARPYTISEYRADDVRAVKGEPVVPVLAGAKLVRVEVAARLHPAAGALEPVFQGVPRHLEYTTGAQKAELAASRGPLAPSDNTVAVLIPIRKSAAWWALPLDARLEHFRPRGALSGHTAIGAPYTDRIYRKLYHSRYAADAGYDFVTYFEFDRAHAGAFRELLAALRDPARNPEWGFVDRELEIWTTRTR